MPKTMTSKVLSALGVSAVFLTACGNGNDASEPDNGTPVVLTSFTVLEDMVSAVAGDRIEIYSITPVGAEIHEYDPTPQDLRNATEADLVIENGLGLELWFEQFVDQTDASSVTVADDVQTLPVTRLPGHPDDAGSSADMPVNPHAWISPTQALGYIDNIESALSELSPDDADHFADNAAEYRAQIQQIHDDAAQRLAALDTQVHLVTCEGAFSYLAEEFGFGEHYLWPLNAENEGTAAQVEAQIAYIQEHQVPTIFCESTVNDSAQQRVAEATGADVGEPLYVDSLSDEDGPVPTYLDLLEYDLDVIISGAESARAQSESAPSAGGAQ